ncbi:MAG: hypothetical protein KJ905_03560 [Nanoarchaeota archaeon]|nr:hypothetical protein [Nanoarchaeota archaeon]MBU2459388.1 hypothetical protein [Nanoarchaeota archaeon]
MFKKIADVATQPGLKMGVTVRGFPLMSYRTKIIKIKLFKKYAVLLEISKNI